jgi:hypothetical protein
MGLQAPSTVDPLASALAAQAKATVEARYLMALQRPRQLMDVRTQLLRECERPSFADDALYSLKFGKTTATGPTIRFMETAARCMRNILAQRRVIYEDAGRVVFEVECMDLENNLTFTSQFSVPKLVERRFLREGQVAISSRTNSSGEIVHTVEPSEGEFFGKAGAYTSRIIREGLRRLIPGDLIEDALETIAKTKADRDRKDPDAAKKKLADIFAGYGVTVADLEKFVLGKPFTATLTPADVDHLRTTAAALKEGELTVAELLRKPTDDDAASATNAALKDKLRGKPAAEGKADA